MLRYEVKLGKDNFKQNELVWSEKYLAPDLSFISGVTDPSNHLEKYNSLAAKSSIINSDSLLSVSAHNVTRQGYIVARNKKIDVKSDFLYDYSVEKEGKRIDYKYIEVNGKYFYWNEHIGGYQIDNLLNYNQQTSAIVETLTVQTESASTFINVNEVFWIEDGKVTIDGNEYFYDKNEGIHGVIKYGEDGDALVASAITNCESIDCCPYTSLTEYKDVTKFVLTKENEISESFSRISFCRYYYYIKYKNHYCQIKNSISGDSYEFLCEVPTYVISGETHDGERDLTPINYKVYFSDDIGNDLPNNAFKEAVEYNQVIDNGHYSEHGVKLLDELKNVIAFVYIKEDDAYFTVEYDIVNANNGNEIIVYLDNVYSPLKVGEKLEFIDTSDDKHVSLVYNSVEYSGKNEDFVVLNGKKYLVEKNLCDKVLINKNEYSIDYINGKKENVNCLVLIGEEKVPMKITSIGDEENGGTLERYGWIVKESNSEASKATYDIVNYDGITINGVKYIIRKENKDGIYAEIDLRNKYTFIITDIIGNSTYICKPFINNTDFTDDFDRFISQSICSDVVDNQRVFDLQIKNKIFGETEITKDLAFRRSENPISSSDYYDLFNDLNIYVNSGYMFIPLTLNTSIGNNVLQDDIVTKDFFEAEKKKAINPIVDMEKDVYVPKFIYGYYDNNGKENVYKGDEKKLYKGSKTIFKPIYQINLNFHFRTRNLDNWKVNDGYNNLVFSADTKNPSLDNWFITDFYPYRSVLSKSGDILQQTSDLMGLLNFSNDDIYYQKSKVAKSFARLSFYDSTDPQTQSLLATSCVFIDEHKLYKTFIDNSRKNVYDYAKCEEPSYKTNSSGFTDSNVLKNIPKEDVTSFIKFNKISTLSEFLGEKRKNIPYSSITIDESHRISSRLTINNKYESDSSSEGFYLYIFREYSENLHPQPIYMKVEFNHAGIGKQIPFLIPMHWSGNTTNSGETGYNKMYPEHALKLSSQTELNEITNLTDLDELKQGIPLSYVYAQTYIPLYAVYDFENKEYAYVFDDRYVKEDENGVLNLNLFEMKIMDENAEPTTQELIDIKLNRQKRAIVNINEGQFNKNQFNYKTE